MKRMIISAGIICCSVFSVPACLGCIKITNPQQQKEFKEIPNPEKNAKLKTDAMQKLLSLTDKQYKKIYKINLSEEKSRIVEMTNRNGEINENGKNKEHPHMGNGRPPMNNGRPLGEFNEERPPMPPSRFGKENDKRQEEMEKRNKKIKKILTDSQYQKWMEQEQSHPDFHPDKRPE